MASGSRYIACSLAARETTCSQSCFPATAVTLSPLYTAVTWQCFYMPHYLLQRNMCRTTVVESNFSLNSCCIRDTRAKLNKCFGSVEAIRTDLTCCFDDITFRQCCIFSLSKRTRSPCGLLSAARDSVLWKSHPS
jgi:hypothetical protein